MRLNPALYRSQLFLSQPRFAGKFNDFFANRWGKVAVLAGGLGLATGGAGGFIAGKSYSDYLNNAPVTVSENHDGDTFIDSEGKEVRMYGIDAPEVAYLGSGNTQPLAQRAQRELSALLNGRTYECISKGTSLGRRVCIVMANGVNVNLEMLRRGWAYMEREHTRKKDWETFEAAEREAREARRGLWQQSPNGGERPWDYRARIRAERGRAAASGR